MPLIIADIFYDVFFCAFIQQAKSNGDSVTVETCPHYLAFSAEEIKDGDTRFKCAPPIRDAANKERLWTALLVLTDSRMICCLFSSHHLSMHDLNSISGR